MTATSLRYVLIGAITVMVVGFSAAAWWAHGRLASSVRATERAKADAEVSQIELHQLKTLQKQFKNESGILEKAKEIAVSSEQYRYQDQVIKDVSDYANRYGISINTIDFTAVNNQPAANGSKKIAFNVTLKGPLQYTTFMRFLRGIEKNLTKIQVTSLTLTPDRDPNSITNPALGLEVYVKS